MTDAMTNVLYFGDRAISFDDSTDVEVLKDDIQRAVQNGGAWVDIEVREQTVSVFFSAGQYVRLAAGTGGFIAV